MDAVPSAAHRAAAVLLLVACAAPAAEFLVSKQADTADGVCDSDCSLREAIQAANALPGSDRVVLQHGYYGIALTSNGGDDDAAESGDLDLSDDVDIVGLRTPSYSAIDANQLDRVLEVLPGVTATLSDIHLRDGRYTGEGGCIHNAGHLTLTRTQVLNCRARAGSGEARGGGIYNVGELRIVYGRIDNNFAYDDINFNGGRGGGIYNAAGAMLYLYDSNLRHNLSGYIDATGYGGGLYNLGQARIDRSFFGYNRAGDGEGNAIANRHGGSVAVFNSTIGNNGNDGSHGAIANGSARPDDGEASSRVVIGSATIAYNNGGGLLNNGTALLRNSIIAGNFTQDSTDLYFNAGRNCYNLADARYSQSYSLIGADGDCSGAYSIDNSRVFTTELMRLGYDGGSTPVYKLRAGAISLDAAEPASCAGIDQHRQMRPIDSDGDGVAVCDLGALEVPQP